MPESLALGKTDAQDRELTRQERRQIRRVGVALQVRIRTAEPEDGDFEEVRTTQNASKKAIYFFSPLNGYYKGMKLRVTFPFDPNANAATNIEQPGCVLRVHRCGTGFGVAVALNTEGVGQKASTYAQLHIEPTAHNQNPSKHDERRCAKRNSFIAPVELIETRSGTRLKARTADLSLHGCYIDTLNPLPVGSTVRLQMQRADETLDAMAQVTSQHAGSGMGLEFREMSLEQRALLKGWLAECCQGPEPAHANPGFSRKPKQVNEIDEPYAVRLINALVRKGILSKSEATELLRDPES